MLQANVHTLPIIECLFLSTCLFQSPGQVVEIYIEFLHVKLLRLITLLIFVLPGDATFMFRLIYWRLEHITAGLVEDYFLTIIR